jgi:hypothetical protein
VYVDPRDTNLVSTSPIKTTIPALWRHTAILGLAALHRSLVPITIQVTSEVHLKEFAYIHASHEVPVANDAFGGGSWDNGTKGVGIVWDG